MEDVTFLISKDLRKRGIISNSLSVKICKIEEFLLPMLPPHQNMVLVCVLILKVTVDFMISLDSERWPRLVHNPQEWMMSKLDPPILDLCLIRASACLKMQWFQ